MAQILLCQLGGMSLQDYRGQHALGPERRENIEAVKKIPAGRYCNREKGSYSEDSVSNENCMFF